MATQPPKRYLSPDSEPWGRWVEDNLNTIGSDITQSNQSITSALASINGTLVKMSDQINTLTKQQAWLSSATLYSSVPTNPSAWVYTVNPPATTNVSPAFDAQYDSELTFTAPASGQYLVSMSSNQVQTIDVNTAWGSITTHLWFEVYNANTGITQQWEGLSFSENTTTAAAGATLYTLLPVSRSFPFTFYESNVYRIRTRRQVTTSHGGATVGSITANILTTPFSIVRANLV